MADREMLMVFCYDIARANTRNRVADLLEAAAVRVQDSVFETRLSRAAADRLFQHIVDVLDQGDLLRMYAIGAAGLDRCRAHGGMPMSSDNGFWIV